MKLENKYLLNVLKNVKKRNPTEPEFIQAVTEVFMTLQPVIEKRPDLVKAGVIEKPAKLSPAKTNPKKKKK